MIPTVAALTDQGPRAENEDRCFAALDAADGSWLIAVADGLGGHDRGAEAAAAAVEGLPARCASLAELQDAFAAAERRFESLSAVPSGWRDLRRVPMSTLCAASWTPTGGLHVGQTGDTVAVLIRRPRRALPRARPVFLPHRTGYGTISSCLGLNNLDTASTDSWASPELDAAAAHTLIILSDGTWEPLDRDAAGGGRDLCDALERPPPGSPEFSVSATVASVASATDCGPRPANEDRSFTALNPQDGSWVIAVADGISGTAEPHTAAQAATEGIPERIESLEEMRAAFENAADRVDALVPTWEEFLAAKQAETGESGDGDCATDSDLRLAMFLRSRPRDRWYGEWKAMLPATTLCVAAWTHQGGLLVGSMGDTLAFEMRWPPDGPPFRRLVAEPHRDRHGAGVTSYLGLGASRRRLDAANDGGAYTPNFAAVAVAAPADPATPLAVVVASDGVWESLHHINRAARDAAASPEALAVRRAPLAVLPDDWPFPVPDPAEEPLRPLRITDIGFCVADLAHAVASVLGPPADARTAAVRVLEAARVLGLEDNATVAVAVHTPAPTPASAP